jgi:hypothetical protein
MRKMRNLTMAAVITAAAIAGGGAPRADDAEETVSQHIVGEPLLAAHLVRSRKAGTSPRR